MWQEQEGKKMETIKKYLEGINSDEGQIRDFLETHETEIKDFFKSLWEKQFVQSVESTQQVESQTTEILEEKKLSEKALNTSEQTTDNNQQQADMKIFDSGKKVDRENVQNETLAFQIKNKQITFQNGKVGKEYCVDFDFENLEFAEIYEVTFDGLENIGLEYCPNEKKITGMPTEAGDHKITMKFKIRGYEDRTSLEREVVFIINPDPRVLWSKNIPTPEDIEYYKPDNDKLFIKVESKRKKGICKNEIARKDMAAASQRGRSHAIEGKPRDDDFALHFDEETECYVMMVADGAGSAKYSRKGSQIACDKAMIICKEKLLVNKDVFQKRNKEEYKNEIGKILQETISNAIFGAYKAIENEAQEKGYLVKDFSTTLILTICKKFEYGWFVGAWWVGDGGIGIYNKETQLLKVLGEPDGGEYAGQTRFLTMPDIIKNELYSRMKFEIIEDFTAIILMTDGVTDPKFETDANLNRIEKWDTLWEDLNGNNEDNAKVDFSDNNEQSDEQLLKWLDFWSKGNHDDRTIAILF